MRRGRSVTAVRVERGQSHFPADMMAERIFSIGLSRLYVSSEHVPTSHSHERETENSLAHGAGRGKHLQTSFLSRCEDFLGGLIL